MTVLGLGCCVGAFCSCCQQGLLSSCSAWAQLLCGMWDLPRSGIESMSHALASGLFTIEPLGKPCLEPNSQIPNLTMYRNQQLSNCVNESKKEYQNIIDVFSKKHLLQIICQLQKQFFNNDAKSKLSFKSLDLLQTLLSCKRL